MEFSTGLMDDPILETISMIKKKDMAHSHGLMEDYTLVVGKMESNMEKEPTKLRQENQKKAIGKKAKGLNGVMVIVQVMNNQLQ